MSSRPVFYYRVKAGDTLSGVAVRYGMTVPQVKQLNRIFANDIFQGQLIKVHADNPSDELFEAPPPDSPPPLQSHSTHSSSFQSQPLSMAARSRSSSSASHSQSHSPTSSASAPHLKLSTTPPSHSHSRNSSPTPHDTGSAPSHSSLSNASTPPADTYISAALEATTLHNQQQQHGSPSTSPASAPMMIVNPDDYVFLSDDIVAMIEESNLPKPVWYHTRVPALLASSTCLLTETQRKQVVHSLPSLMRPDDWLCVYSTTNHGFSLSTLYRKAEHMGPLVLVVKDEEGHVLGAFLSETLHHASRYYGTGESFVFRSSVEDPEVLAIFRWSMKNSLFILTKDGSVLGVGGGGGGYAIHLDRDLSTGMTAQCDTFDSPPLSRDGVEQFEPKSVELWAPYKPRNRAHAGFLADWEKEMRDKQFFAR